jgi:hypothetical protein
MLRTRARSDPTELGRKTWNKRRNAYGFASTLVAKTARSFARIPLRSCGTLTDLGSSRLGHVEQRGLWVAKIDCREECHTTRASPRSLVETVEFDVLELVAEHADDDGLERPLLPRIGR